MRTRTRTILAGLVLAAALVGGVAWATIPNENGVYTACKLNATGTIRLIDPSGPSTSLLSRCTTRETQITWNQKGPKGEPGGAGANGTNGVDGTNGADGAKGDPCLATDPGCIGPKGDTGAAGAQGPQGEPGPQGPAGTGAGGTVKLLQIPLGTTPQTLFDLPGIGVVSAWCSPTLLGEAGARWEFVNASGVTRGVYQVSTQASATTYREIQNGGNLFGGIPAVIFHHEVRITFAGSSGAPLSNTLSADIVISAVTSSAPYNSSGTEPGGSPSCSFYARAVTG